MSNQLYKLKVNLRKIPAAIIKTRAEDGRKYLIIDIAMSGMFDNDNATYLDLDMREN